MMRKSRIANFFGSMLGAGAALGLAFASGLVLLQGRSNNTVIAQKQKTVGTEKPAYTLLKSGYMQE